MSIVPLLATYVVLCFLQIIFKDRAANMVEGEKLWLHYGTYDESLILLKSLQ